MGAEKIIDIKINPTKKDLWVFAVLWAVFFVVVGVLAFATQWFLLKVAIFTGTCFLISLALNKDYPRKQQWPGVLIPAGFLAIWGFEYIAHTFVGGFFNTFYKVLGLNWPVGDGAQWTVLAVVAAVGVLGMFAMLASKDLATKLYRGWMFAALPIGWVISHLILGVVYYLVLSPIGLIMRLTGYDPMSRKLDPAATTYWLPHKQQTDNARYFRQF